MRVGPTNEVRILHTQYVWNRTYFRDPRQGLNYFGYTDGIWDLQHPALSTIQPADFTLAAEYLESGGVGFRAPCAGEMDAAFAQCVAAWFVAHALNMADLMDDIVDKLEEVVLTPGLAHVLRFARRVYASTSRNAGSLYHDRLKEYLAGFVAENWWAYLTSDLRDDFMQAVRECPELERDVYETRIVMLEERVQDEEEEEVDDDDDSEESEESEGDTE